MKVLSLKQPYAELIVSGCKTIELRKWNTKFRGKFLVHASLNTDKDAVDDFYNKGLIKTKDLPVGCIVGSVVLVDVKKYDTMSIVLDKDKHLANIDYGCYGFVLVDFRRCDLVYVRGKLGFWSLDL